MLTNEELAYQGAIGLINTGVEGPYSTVCCSTAGNYPSMGVSCWEGIEGRGDYLLSCINGGDKFIGRSYYDIVDSGEIEELSALLDSPQGQEAQNQILAVDCLNSYIPALLEAGLSDARCIIYAMIWCPTSHVVVSTFVGNRLERGFDINNLQTLYELFYNEYATAAGCEDYAEGYQNRANTTYNYCASLDLSAYGIPPYSC